MSGKVTDNPLGTAVSDIRRLTYTRDYIQKLGSILTQKRVLLRVGILSTFLITGLNQLFKNIGMVDLTTKQVLYITGAATFLTFIIGKACQILPGVVNRRGLYAAEGNLLASMNIYRQSQAEKHLTHLYRRVYQFEADNHYKAAEQLQSEEDIRFNRDILKRHLTTLRNRPQGQDVLHAIGADSDEEIDHLVSWVDYANPHSDQMERCEQSFLISSMYAILQRVPQTVQLEEIGFELAFYQHFLSGGPLHESDNALSEIQMYNALFQEMRRDLGHRSGSWSKQIKKALADIRLKSSDGSRFFVQKQWHAYTLGKLGVEAGIRLNRLNNMFQEYSFNAQDLLWPGSENARYFRENPGAEMALIEERRGLIQMIFGREWDHALRMINYLCKNDFLILTRLRASYDPHYGLAAKRLPWDALGDARDEGCSPRFIRSIEAILVKNRQALEVFERELEPTQPKLWTEANSEELRALRTGFQIDWNGMRSHYRRHGLDEDMQAYIEACVSEKRRFTEKLIALRVVHELSRVRLNEYRLLVAKLMGHELEPLDDFAETETR